MATIEDRVGVNKKKLQRDLEHVFSLFDEDSDGLLTLREWEAVSQDLDIQIREEFQKDDTMEEQKISLTQFLEEINGKLQGLSAEGEAQEAFELIDKNKDGLISMEELRAVLNTLGKDIEDDELYEMLRESNKSGTGFLNKDEFRAMLYLK